MVDLRILVQEARETVEVLHDEKVWASEEEMKALIEAGAQTIQNRRQTNGSYIIEVMFDGIRFIHASKQQLLPAKD